MATQKSSKSSEPDKVNEYMKNLDHPLAEVVEALRQIILSTDPEIGEEIKWNAPTFFLYRRYASIYSQRIQEIFSGV